MNAIAYPACKLESSTIVKIVSDTGILLECFEGPHQLVEKWAMSPRRKEFLERHHGEINLRWSWSPWKLDGWVWFKENYQEIWGVAFAGRAEQDADGPGAKVTY